MPYRIFAFGNDEDEKLEFLHDTGDSNTLAGYNWIAFEGTAPILTGFQQSK